MNLLFSTQASLKAGGGAEIYIIDVVPKLLNIGYNIKIISPKSTLNQKDRFKINEIYEKLKCEIIEYDVITPPFLNYPTIPTQKGIKKVISNIEASDVVIFQFFYFHDIMNYILKKMKKTYFISEYRSALLNYQKVKSNPLQDSLRSAYLRNISKKIVKFFDAHRVLNETDKQVLKQWGASNIVKIPNAIDINKFKPLKRFKNTYFKILFVGRMTFQKGVDILIEAINYLNRMEISNKINFILVGDGDLEYLVENIHKFKNVKWLGYIKNDKLPDLYNNCDLMVMPSRWETFGRTALEAQSCGLPVLASNIRGLNEVIIDEVTGWLVPLEDPIQIVNWIKEISTLFFDDYEIYLKMRKESRNNVVNFFTWKKVLPQLKSLYDITPLNSIHV